MQRETGGSAYHRGIAERASAAERCAHKGGGGGGNANENPVFYLTSPATANR